MGELAGKELTVFFLGLAILLGSAHLLGELARRLGQPIVIGEMAAGLLLGPTVLGWLAPELQQALFPHEGPAATALDAVVVLGVALLLLTAGMEIDLSKVWRHGRAATLVALGTTAVPLLVGAVVASLAPSWWGMPATGTPGTFAAFFGAALAVSALPVIAKILLDLDLFQSDFGVLVLVAATLTNLCAWLVFSVTLESQGTPDSILRTVLLTVGFAAAMLTVGRWVAHLALSWVQAHLTWPSGVLGFVLVSGLLGAAATEAIGVHAIFGAFLVGIALGDSPHMREQTRHIVHRFVEGILAPIFVGAIGLEVNFLLELRPGLVLGVLALGMAVKLVGTWLGARLADLRGVEVWGLGWALNARGEVGIVLGLLAFQDGLIREQLFVALVVLAVVTSGLAGPMLVRLLKRERPLTLGALLDTRGCVLDLEAADSGAAIRALAAVASERAGLRGEDVARAVLAREQVMGTGVGNAIAVPHARLDSLATPVVVVGLLGKGVAFGGPDDEPVRLIFLILTPAADPAVQLQVLAAIGRFARDQRLRTEALAARRPTDLLGTLRIADSLAPGAE